MKKKKNIKIYIIIVLILLFYLAFKFLSLSIINGMYYNYYDNGDYKKAGAFSKPLLVMNFFEPYIVHYNYGNALYYQEEYIKAQSQFEKSLDKNPPQKRVCDVRINLAITIEKQGDLIVENDRETALKFYKEARLILYEDDCAHENDNSGSSEVAEETEERIKEKDSSKKPTDGGDGENPTEPEPSDDPETGGTPIPIDIEDILKDPTGTDINKGDTIDRDNNKPKETEYGEPNW